MTVYQYRFDFEVGNLIKSPCKECAEKNELPKCIDECEILDKLHEILAETRSCAKSI